MAGKDPAPDKVAAARQAAAELRAKQRAASRRATVFGALGALAIVGVIVAILLFIAKGGSEAPEDIEQSPSPYDLYDSGVLKAPAAADDSGGILVGAGGVAGVEAPVGAVRVDLYEDPICPFCGLFVQYASGEIGALVDSGQIEFYFHPVSYFDDTSLGNRYSTRAVNAIATVAEHDPEHFWVFTEALMVNQPQEGTAGLTNAEIESIARTSGVAEDAIARIADGEFTRWASSVSEQALNAGIRATPMLLIGGVLFNGWITSEYEPATGQISAAVAYVEENGAEAFADLLAGLLDPAPSP